MRRLSPLHLFRFLASLRLAVAMLVVLAAVLAWAAAVEAHYGRACAKWYIYDRVWFLALWGLLAVNIFCAAAIRFPWQRHQAGFVVTHLGLLILLAGGLQTHLSGIEGMITLAEGESTEYLDLPERNRITARWAGRSEPAAAEFTFAAGPVDWPDGRQLDVGEVDGVSVRILRFFPDARLVHDWVRDDTGAGTTAVKLRASDRAGRGFTERWLTDQPSRDTWRLGPLRLRLMRADSDQALADFLDPRTAPPSPTWELLQSGTGQLYGRRTLAGQPPVLGPVSVGERLRLPGAGEVTLVEHWSSARPAVRFESALRATGLPHESRERRNAAVLVEFAAAGTTQKVWLRRQDPVYGRRTVTTPRGSLIVAYQAGRRPLGFRLTLREFHRVPNPGNVGNASFASRVDIDEGSRGRILQREISMNQPLSCRGFRIYQAGFKENPQGRDLSRLSAASDPGRATKYAGGLLVCLGIALMFSMRAYSLSPRMRTRPQHSRELAASDPA